MSETPSKIANKRTTSRLKIALRIAVSLGLAAVVYLAVDTQALIRAISSLSWRGAVALSTLYILGQVLSAMKWRVFVDAVGIKRTPYEILRAYFLGMFVNVYGFGTVGGDVTRALMLNPAKGQRAGAFATVVADRIQGLFVLLGIGSVCVLSIRPPELGNWSLLLGLGGLASLALIIACWYAGPAVVQKIFPENHRFGSALHRMVLAFPRDSKTLATVTFISFLFHNVQILMHLVIAWELKAPLTLAMIYATVPFVNIAASLPISIMNGLGVREFMYRTLFVRLGVAPAISVAFGTIWLFVVTLVSSVGILLLTPGSKEIINEGDSDENLPTEPEALAKRAVG